MFAQPLDVRDQMPGRVLDQAGARPAAAAAALIEYDDAVVQRIEELPRTFVGTRAGTAVKEYGGLAGGVSAFLVVNFMNVRNAQITVAEWFDGRVQFAPRGCCDFRRFASRRPFASVRRCALRAV
jgi:hypothetical protein